jgi:hypothetical protein
MKQNQIIKLVSGICLTAFGVFWVFFPTMVLFHEVEAGFLGTLIVLFIFGIIPTAQGLLLIRKVLVIDKEDKLIEMENKIFELAHENKGTLTPSKLASSINMPVIEAKKFLNELKEEGFAQLNVTENGIVYYDFKDVLFSGDTAA